MSIQTELGCLATEDWIHAAVRLEEVARDELLSNKGLIREVKKQNEAERKAELQYHTDSLRSQVNLDGLDEKVLATTTQWKETNFKYANRLFFDHMAAFATCPQLKRYPNMGAVISHFYDDTTPPIVKNRLAAVIAKVANASLTQANRANAGTAGETLVRTVLEAAGLEKGVHFREQYKSKKGSDTDFVFPNIPDNHDQDLEIMIAVQLSSNDRTRLSTSELKSGGQAFLVTGNGLAASTKRLDDMGTQILAGLESANVRLVCYKGEIDFELKRINDRLSVASEGDRADLIVRQKYFSSHAISFETFATRLKLRYMGRKL